MEKCFDQDGKPNSKLTSEKWKPKFSRLLYDYVDIAKLQDWTMREDIIAEYCNGDGTDEEPYEIFLRSVIINLLDKERDYCYNLNQIIDLLKIFGDFLISRYDENERCFEVWLYECN